MGYDSNKVGSEPENKPIIDHKILGENLENNNSDPNVTIVTKSKCDDRNISECDNGNKVPPQTQADPQKMERLRQKAFKESGPMWKEFQADPTMLSHPRLEKCIDYLLTVHNVVNFVVKEKYLAEKARRAQAAQNQTRMEV